MKRIYQTTSIILILLGVCIFWGSLQLKYYTTIGPGPGFFPRWVGLLFTLLSTVWFLEVTLKPCEPIPADWIPSRAGQMRMGAIVAALALAIWLVDVIGFSLTMFPFLLFSITVLGRQSTLITSSVALAGSFGVAYVFSRFLDVYLPVSPFEVLSQFGF
jgi:putative tricarboxylic transport membrane protein